MTAISNLVASLDCPNPPILDLFSDEYRAVLLNRVDDFKLQAAKILVEEYIKSKLSENIVCLKVYAYKTLEGMSVEIFIQPENTSTIIQYVLKLTDSNTSLVRIR